MLLQAGIRFLCQFLGCLQNSPTDQSRQFQTDFKQTKRNIDFNTLDTGSSPIVYTHSGWVEGYFQNTFRGRSIAAFESIPYAMPPTGDRRFRKPEPFPKWSEVKETKQLPPACLQIDVTQLFLVHGVEDCLFMNIYTPILPSFENKKPGLSVLVFIHGGGFASGTSKDYGAAYLLDRDVILVTFNYRVGILGFLATNDSSSYGNWGLKDQVLALQFVQDNIKFFGGDPSKVTLMGQSTGAALVGLHMISKKSEGLFHRAICQSGSNMAFWSVINDTVLHSKIIANGVNCPIDSGSEAMVDCLRSRDPIWVVAHTMDTYKEWISTTLRIGPVVEPPNEDAFLDEAPEVAYQSGKVKPRPMIIGFTKDEGNLFSVSWYLTPMMLGKFNHNWINMSAYGLCFEDQTNDTELVAQKVKDFYVQGRRLSFFNRKGWSQAIGDRLFLQGTYSAMQYHSLVAPTYGYVVSFDAKNTLLDVFGIGSRLMGMSHGDDLIMIFNSSRYRRLKLGSDDYKVSELILNLWTSFADTGVPTSSNNDIGKYVQWTKINDPLNFDVLEINKTPQMIPIPFLDRIRFWDSLGLRNDRPFPISQITQNRTIIP